MDDLAATAPRSVWLGVRRGAARRCPNCGQGPLFAGYLKLRPVCEACGYALGEHRADDGPAYVTILLVGHLVIGPLLCFPFIWTANPILVSATVLPALAALTLCLLPIVKGGFVGAQWGGRTG